MFGGSRCGRHSLSSLVARALSERVAKGWHDDIASGMLEDGTAAANKRHGKWSQVALAPTRRRRRRCGVTNNATASWQFPSSINSWYNMELYGIIILFFYFLLLYTHCLPIDSINCLLFSEIISCCCVTCGYIIFILFFIFCCFSLRTRQPGRLNSGGVRMELARALDLWARNSKLTFQEINSDDADILVYFHRY